LWQREKIFRGTSNRMRRVGAVEPCGSKQFSLARPPSGSYGFDSAMVDHFAGIGLGDTGSNLFKLPLLCVQICLYGFGQKVGSVAVERIGEFIECGYFVGCQAEADGLFLHNAAYYLIL